MPNEVQPTASPSTQCQIHFEMRSSLFNGESLFEKNIFSCGQFGVSGSGSTPGIQTINQYFRNWTFRDNILVGTVGQKKYPPDNTIVPGVTEVGFVDPAQGDFRLQNTSPGRKLLGTDNSPPGVDLELLQAWTAGVAEGRPPVVADE